MFHSWLDISRSARRVWTLRVGATWTACLTACSDTEMEAVSEISIPVPWGEIRGKAWGPDHSHPVLCLHGWADNCGTFNTLIPLLPRECRYVAMDLPGHGLSSHYPLGAFYSSPSYVAAVRRAVDGLQWKRFSIIGHSMGGNIALMFSALYPEMVDTLIMLDAFGFQRANPSELIRSMRKDMDEVLEFESKTEEKQRVYTYQRAAERMSAANPPLSEEAVRTLLERGLLQTEGGFVFSRDYRVHSRTIVRFSQEESLELQGRILASVLLVLADDGFGKIQKSQSPALSHSALIQGHRDRNHTVVTVPGDHHVHLNNPEAVAPFVSDFLRARALPALPESISLTDSTCGVSVHPSHPKSRL